nr:hypothetical protein [Patescibacteria group bacterium]
MTIYLHKIFLLYLITCCVFTNGNANNSREHYYIVDKLEIYGIVNNEIILYEVRYFEGKISIKEESGQLKCISIKNNDEYLKFKSTDNNNLLITSPIFKECKGIINKNLLSQNQILINLADKDFILKYYLKKL